MTSQRAGVRALTAAEQEQAKELFKRRVRLIGADSFDDLAGEARAVRHFMATTGDPAPQDTWLGLVEGGKLLGAVHAGPNYGQAVQILQILGQPGAGSPDWLRMYVERVASLDEIAVEPAHERRGVGAALLRAVVTALVSREAVTVSGFATSTAMIELARSQGFAIGGYKEPVPASISANMRTAWWDLAPDDGRYFWKVLPARGQSLGVRAGGAAGGSGAPAR